MIWAYWSSMKEFVVYQNGGEKKAHEIQKKGRATIKNCPFWPRYKSKLRPSGKVVESGRWWAQFLLLPRRVFIKRRRATDDRSNVGRDTAVTRAERTAFSLRSPLSSGVHRIFKGFSTLKLQNFLSLYFRN